MQEGRWSVTNFSSLPFYSFSLSFFPFFRWCHGVVVLLVPVFPVLTFLRMATLSLSVLDDLEISHSAAGLNIIVMSQDGPRCKSMRTVDSVFSVENAGPRRRLCSSSVRGLRAAGLVISSTEGSGNPSGVLLLPRHSGERFCVRLRHLANGGDAHIECELPTGY